jgi:metal-sulfur cluster biosynthetic enzyme
MTQTMITKIDHVLDRVIEKESALSVAQLGLVERVRYSEKQNKLYVFTKAIHSTHGCCTLLSLVQQSDTLQTLEDQFKQEFPEHWVQIVNV